MDMDTKLRALKRQAAADPSLYPAYARALERALGGQTQFEQFDSAPGLVFAESYVADAHLEDFLADCESVGGYNLVSSGSSGYIASMVEVGWEQAWDENEALEIKSRLSDEFIALLESAQKRGYEYIILWV
jgi:hypothetical protein